MMFPIAEGENRSGDPLQVAEFVDVILGLGFTVTKV
jgi:hypothetical protein